MPLITRQSPTRRGKVRGGQNVYAASASDTDVQAAIDAAASGDTVIVPAGEATWTTPVVISNKSLTVQGAGIGQTIITSNTGTASPLQFTCTSTAYAFTALDMEWFIYATGSANGIISAECSNAAGYPAVACRIGRMKMTGDPTDGTTNASSSGRFVMVAAMYGVVHNCQFISATTRGIGNVSAGRDNGITTANSYHIPLRLGTSSALYIEDCDFQFAVANQGNGATDNYSGARYVVRYCTIKNNNVGHHGWDSQPRGVPSFEHYGNTFTAEAGIADIHLCQPRSGTGVMWGNTVRNYESAANGYVSFLAPIYYGALTPAAQEGNAWLNSRATGYYPSGTWGALPYPGTSSVTDGLGNKVTGSNPIDGNQFGADHMDADYSRTVNDLVTTEGSTTITSASASFVSGDLVKRIYASNITRGRTVTDGVWTSGDATVTSATANFGPGDVGRLIGMDGYTIPQSTFIASINSSTSVEMNKTATGSGTGNLYLVDTYLVSITNSTTAVLNTPATASGTNGTLTIGYTNQGYPLADQPGRGAFPSANPGNWPNETSYTEAEYQELAPIYCWGNHWQEVADDDQEVLSDTAPPAGAVSMDGAQGYIKHGREWYDDADVGSGTFAELPATCAVNDAFWVTDRGGHWNLTTENANDGALYKCLVENEWTLFYVPYTYPHPLRNS